ncbi:hypothetical protein BN4901_1657 [Citrobacter europaeus]|uniref:Uncharacterized protein n=1 Tax=Citrobacter europaeus TaxID=1914243 RepID=A0ABY0JMB8_9ENTR|nr:hypothetical protein BN4901_1657 [Citrobacter europaeus]
MLQGRQGSGNSSTQHAGENLPMAPIPLSSGIFQMTVLLGMRFPVVQGIPVPGCC